MCRVTRHSTPETSITVHRQCLRNGQVAVEQTIHENNPYHVAINSRSESSVSSTANSFRSSSSTNDFVSSSTGFGSGFGRIGGASAFASGGGRFGGELRSPRILQVRLIINHLPFRIQRSIRWELPTHLRQSVLLGLSVLAQSPTLLQQQRERRLMSIWTGVFACELFVDFFVFLRPVNNNMRFHMYIPNKCDMCFCALVTVPCALLLIRFV